MVSLYSSLYILTPKMHRNKTYLEIYPSNFFFKYLNTGKVSRAYLDFFLGKLTEYKRGKKPTRSEYVQTMTNESKREKNSRFFVLFLKIGIQDAKSPALLAYAMRKN